MCNSCFGSHGLAKEWAASKRAFLMMAKRSTYGVTLASEQVQEGQTAVCTFADFKYRVCVHKNPKVRHKPPRVVPMLTNVWFARKGPPHRRSGREVHRTNMGSSCTNGGNVSTSVRGRTTSSPTTSWEDWRHPLTLRPLGAPPAAPGVGHLSTLFFEAHPNGTLCTRVRETGGAGYAQVEYICTHLGTLFDGVP